MQIKNIHIGKLLKTVWEQREVEMTRTCNFLKCEEEMVQEMFRQKSIETELLLKWSKLLEYDFFRVYSQHLILFTPVASNNDEKKNNINKKERVPVFRKNIYTNEIIDYLLGLIKNKEKTPMQIVKEYKIPKTTLYRWIQKYKKE